MHGVAVDPNVIGVATNLENILFNVSAYRSRKPSLQRLTEQNSETEK